MRESVGHCLIQAKQRMHFAVSVFLGAEGSMAPAGQTFEQIPQLVQDLSPLGVNGTLP